MHCPLYSPPPPSCLLCCVCRVFNPLWSFCRIVLVIPTWRHLLACLLCFDVRGLINCWLSDCGVIVVHCGCPGHVVVEVVVVEDGGGSCFGHVISRGSCVVMRRGHGGQWTGLQQWMVV